MFLVVLAMCDGGENVSFVYGPYATRKAAQAVVDEQADSGDAWSVAELEAPDAIGADEGDDE